MDAAITIILFYVIALLVLVKLADVHEKSASNALPNGLQCPMCKHEPIIKIGILRKITYALIIGFFAIPFLWKTFRCTQCGYIW